MSYRVSTYGIFTPNSRRAGLLSVLFALLLAFPLSVFADDDPAPEPEPEPAPAQVLVIGGNVYGGGNKGELRGTTHVVINGGTFGKDTEGADTDGGNIFAGARMADVHTKPNDALSEGVYAANVTFNGGEIRQDRAVYGGNDITGNVHGGARVDILASLDGDVYGGGNGSYAYTDNADLKAAAESSVNEADKIYADVYYNPTEIKTAANAADDHTADSYGASLLSAWALNKFRPNMDKVLVRLAGTAEKRTILRGSVYLGGNSATLKAGSGTPTAILKMGSYVTVDEVFLGNNGENMVTTYQKDVPNGNGDYNVTGRPIRYQDGVLRTYKSFVLENDFSQMDLTDVSSGAEGTFAEYMDGVAMTILPSIEFDNEYAPYSTYVGSVYCGGNVGSMKVAGKTTITLDKEVIVYDKIVGGCNNANIAATDYNAAYEGGLLGSDAEAASYVDGLYVDTESEEDTKPIQDRLVLNLSGTGTNQGLKIQPMRWKKKYYDDNNLVYTPSLNPEDYDTRTGFTDYVLDASGNPVLEWNTIDATGNPVAAVTALAVADVPETAVLADHARRLKGGNVYGGCYNSGHVNGNVIININGTLHNTGELFDEIASVDEEGSATDILYNIKEEYTITARRTGVALHEQGMDVFGSALNVYGGGFGQGTEIWGSATVNLNRGYTFQIFGGGESGFIGKKPAGYSRDNDNSGNFDARFSTYVNLNGTAAGTAAKPVNQNTPESVFLYGGGLQGDILGNSIVQLGNGRIFNSFAGSCNADILGHTETYVGNTGFPYVIDHIYGGNDLGGKILGSASFAGRIGEINNRDVPDQVYNGGSVLTASAYIEYSQGRMDYIFGGNCGDYDYTTDFPAKDGYSRPYLDNAVVNFRPVSNPGNSSVNKVFGGSQGEQGGTTAKNNMQGRSYVLIDMPQGTTVVDEVEKTVEMKHFDDLEVFGSGANAGLGMRATPDYAAAHPNEVSAIIDLMHGEIAAAYGGSYNEGVTRRTVVNVPEESTIITNYLFGGAYGSSNALPCDVYEAQVNYSSNLAHVNSAKDDDGNITGGIYGGNNSYRRTLYSQVNINSTLTAENGYYGYVFGAGYGPDTWSRYTEVNINNNGLVYEAYGGGYGGMVLNPVSAAEFAKGDNGTADDSDDLSMVIDGNSTNGYDYADADESRSYNVKSLVGTAALYTDLGEGPQKYNANVHIKEGGYVFNYAYGGGYGAQATVSGTTYIDLLGGRVRKDIYSGGTSGAVMDKFMLGNSSFVASANTYIRGGAVRNVYGAGWKGNVGYADPDNTANDVNAESHVYIGNKKPNPTYLDGKPAIQRNVYGGGEGETDEDTGISYGSSVIGTAYVTMYNGYIGYVYDADAEDNNTTAIDEHYVEKINDETATEYVSDDGTIGKDRLLLAGNIFGGGYVDNSNTDNTDIRLYGGYVRNSVYGGGEIGTIGRGANNDGVITISKGGSTKITMFGGNVLQDIFGGGRGYANVPEIYGRIGVSGYVFGKTEVNIHRGTIGTQKTVADGHGNVFGGGDIGYVYSATGKKSGVRGDDDGEGYYYLYDGTNFTLASGKKQLTEDCKVVISPYVQVTAATTIGGHAYDVGDYVETSVLNTLASNNTNWKTPTHTGNFDDLGVNIGNAVFAGGNVTAGSDQVYANTETVFGNATASVTDVFIKDLVTIGSDGVGGLYGDGNLTLVDGYRELNITNYGTDYYNLNSTLSYEDYLQLNDRERAYFELQYQTATDHTYEAYESKFMHNYTDESDHEVTYYVNQKITPAEWALLSPTEQVNWDRYTHHYDSGAKISEEEYNQMDEAERGLWELHGFCTLYAGRILNTIQRADFCGVFGSRIVFRGAQDRVPSVVDYTNYTINRVDEVSLNQVNNTYVEDSHGNYFGIYSVVNYLGALTSDVKFNEVRTTESTELDYQADDHTTYYAWKFENLNNRKRNNGSSANKVALSSGVWLEILDQATETQPNKEKVYGPITGVVELSLLNVAPGEGGGYVYAKNEHRIVENIAEAAASRTTLSLANQNAVSYKQYSYYPENTSGKEAIKMQTSGNFISSSKRIIDDCYPQSNSYLGENASPAHYWYIRGDFYVYDQYISAYTGSAQAYAEKVSIPLTITAESQGKLILNAINENRYAYWTDESDNLDTYRSTTDPTAVIINDITYHKNDPISYWDYSRLSDAEKAFFTVVTYVSMENMTVNDVTYTKGQVLTPEQYDIVPDNVWVCTTPYTDSNEAVHRHGDVLTQTQYEALLADYKQYYESAKSLVHVSNAVSHENGFLLSFVWDNPDIWSDYYHNSAGDGTVRKSLYNSTDYPNYTTSPTFRCNMSGVYGQLNYTVGDLIDQETYDYETQVRDFVETYHLGTQAQFERAYVAKEDCEFTIGTTDYIYKKGAPVSSTFYNGLGANKSYFEVGYVCTETHRISDTEFVLSGDRLTQTEFNAASTELQALLSQLYVCTTDGAWGGKPFTAGNSYPAVNYSNLSSEERANFSYNYDALDLLSENFVPTTDNNNMDWYQGNNIVNNNSLIPPGLQIPYAERQSIDYTATYTGGESGNEPKTLTAAVSVKHPNGTTTTTNTLQRGDELTNTVYESLINEQFHYTPIVVSGNDATGTIYYVVTDGFQVGDNWYNVGNKISGTIYSLLTSENQAKVEQVQRSSLPDLPTGDNTKTYYFCTSAYTAQTAVKDITGNHYSYAVNETVPVGTIIGAEQMTIGGVNYTGYSDLKNEHVGFTIDGKVPTETSTLYVARETDINDLSQDKIITVEYLYDYIESDGSGSSYETIRERHVVNVHIHFESGVPIIGELLPAKTVLPGNVVGLNQPTVTKGAYEILGGGWETYRNLSDATSHMNGTPYTNNYTKMYWYQDGYYVAYYAKTYLGKTYSNAVQLSVANYHDMADVMADADHHMYVDNAGVSRPSKIYIDDEENDTGESELDMFYDLFDLSTKEPNQIQATDENGYPMKDSNDNPIMIDNPAFRDENGHAALNRRVAGLENLAFILSSDVEPIKYSPTNATPSNWTPIGNNINCFGGWFHGNGFTVSGLTNSLFGKVCGDIYNVGVMGSFTEGGIAQSADGDSHIENTWVSTSATGTLGHPIVADVSVSKPYVYNSYYPEEQNWNDHTADDKLDIIEKPLADFVNGQVAYDLNSNYLHARYLMLGGNSNASSSTYNKPKKAYYLKPDGTFVTEPAGTDSNGNPVETNVEYDIMYTTQGTDWQWHSGNGFVEEYMGNGDYRYSDGIVPTQVDVSYNGTETFIPVFPDDYIYFGQVLSYDLFDSEDRPAHDLHPTGVVKDHTTKSGDDVNSSRHLLLTLDEKTGNRLYRAPAYYRDGKYGKSVIFNKSAAFADSYTAPAGTFSAGALTLYPNRGLTAIDFTGGNGDNSSIHPNREITGYQGVVPGADIDYKNRAGGYGPLLDYYGLEDFKTSGITKNLLVYAPAANVFDQSFVRFPERISSDSQTSIITGLRTAANSTISVLNSYFHEPAYTEGDGDPAYSTGSGYRTVAAVTGTSLSNIKGHLVQQVGHSAEEGTVNYTATTDHFLVDKQDFNAPLEYTLAIGKRMWYQRVPDVYAAGDKGWEGVSLPFSAELVTTPDKGEITHFFQGSDTGHEYWLRELQQNASLTHDNNAEAGVLTAPFGLPAAASSSTKTDGNTFLWDYYYSKDEFKDANEDKYEEGSETLDEGHSDKTYYSNSRTYVNYPYSVAGRPYIVGFPGSRYFEFDLSGEFVPRNTSDDAAFEDPKLGAQTITFASAQAVTILKSDDELSGAQVNAGYNSETYTFMPSYLNMVLEAPAPVASAANPNYFVLNSDGSSFDIVIAQDDNDETTNDGPRSVGAFRPYFRSPQAAVSSPAQGRQVATRSIALGSVFSEFGGKDSGAINSEDLFIYTGRGEITIESYLNRTITLDIVNAAGITVRTLTIKPGATVKTRVPSGVYIINGRKYVVR